MKTRGSSFDYVNSLIGSVSLQVLPRREVNCRFFFHVRRCDPSPASQFWAGRAPHASRKHNGLKLNPLTPGLVRIQRSRDLVG